jgi:hypothetical protein
MFAQSNRYKAAVRENAQDTEHPHFVTLRDHADDDDGYRRGVLYAARTVEQADEIAGAVNNALSTLVEWDAIPGEVSQ